MDTFLYLPTAPHSPHYLWQMWFWSVENVLVFREKSSKRKVLLFLRGWHQGSQDTERMLRTEKDLRAVCCKQACYREQVATNKPKALIWESDEVLLQIHLDYLIWQHNRKNPWAWKTISWAQLPPQASAAPRPSLVNWVMTLNEPSPQTLGWYRTVEHAYTGLEGALWMW